MTWLIARGCFVLLFAPRAPTFADIIKINKGAEPLELYPVSHPRQTVWSIRFGSINVDLKGEDAVSKRVRAEPGEWSLCLQAQPPLCSFEGTCFPILKLPSNYFQVPLCLRESARHVNISAWLQRTPPCNQEIQVGDHDGNIGVLMERFCTGANTSFVRSLSAHDPPSLHLTSKLHGGLGNQLFIVFSSIAYCRRFGMTLDFDDEFYSSDYWDKLGKNKGPRHLYWTSLLDGVKQFTSKPPPDSSQVVLRETRFQLPPAPPAGHVEFPMNDWFQSPVYFQEHEQHIFNLLDFPAKRTATCTRFFKALPDVEGFVTISAHFRFGDYQLLGGHISIQPVAYYLDALRRIVEQLSSSSRQQQLRVLVFTDGDFFGDEPLSTATRYVTELEAAFSAMRFEIVPNHSLEDFEQLLVMSCCDHHVIASSTFSWWGAYIHRALREKTDDAPLVAYPATWFGPHNPMILEEDYDKRFPGEWIKVGVPVQPSSQMAQACHITQSCNANVAN